MKKLLDAEVQRFLDQIGDDRWELLLRTIDNEAAMQDHDELPRDLAENIICVVIWWLLSGRLGKLP